MMLPAHVLVQLGERRRGLQAELLVLLLRVDDHRTVLLGLHDHLVLLALALLEPELAAPRHLVVLRGEAEPARVVLKPEAAVAVT